MIHSLNISSNLICGILDAVRKLTHITDTKTIVFERYLTKKDQAITLLALSLGPVGLKLEI